MPAIRCLSSSKEKIAGMARSHSMARFYACNDLSWRICACRFSTLAWCETSR